MAINDLTYTDVSAILADINSQASGRAVLAPTNTADFVALAQTTLKMGYDVVTNAISQVLSRTIFSIRPYDRKFRGLEADAIRFGHHVRKINYIDDDPEADGQYLAATFTDGSSVDPWIVNKKKVVQTNFYGQTGYSRHRTYYRSQLDMAFRSADELASFWAGVTQHDSDMIEKDHEEFARAALANLIGGAYLQDAASPAIADGKVIHLLTEYNAWSGESLDATTVYNPQNFEGFARWLFGRLETLSKSLAERSSLYHQTFDDGNGNDLKLERHTPAARQRLYMNVDPMNQIAANVLSTTFNTEYLRMAQREDVSFWQNIKDPLSIDIVAGYTDKSGAVQSAAAQLSKIVFGVIFDVEACGYTVTDTWTMATPMNARGGYWNQWYHYTDRYWNDFSENSVVLLLD